MAWTLEESRLLRWTIRPIAYLVMQIARLGVWISDGVIRASLRLGADPGPLDRFPPHVRERLLKREN